jgi:hypothetical protein
MKLNPIFVFIIFFSCTGPVFINNNYKEKDFSNNTLALWPTIPQYFDVGISIFDESLDNQCFNIIQNEIKTKCNRISVLTLNNTKSFKQLPDTSMFIFKGKIRKDTTIYDFPIPKPSYLNIYNKTPDLLLIIKSIEMIVKKRMDKSVSSFNGQVASSPNPFVTTKSYEAKVLFIIWSYKDNEPIVFGKAKVRSFLDIMDDESLFKNVARTILSKTQFHATDTIEQ